MPQSTSGVERSDEPATSEKGPELKNDVPAIPPEERFTGLAVCCGLSFMSFLYLWISERVCAFRIPDETCGRLT